MSRFAEQRVVQSSAIHRDADTWNAVSEHAYGSKGTVNIVGATISDNSGNVVWSYGCTARSSIALLWTSKQTCLPTYLRGWHICDSKLNLETGIVRGGWSPG